MEAAARDLIASAELAEECPEHLPALRERADAFGFRLSAFELLPLLHRPHDGDDAFVYVQGAPGDGGVWPGMLLRQYQRWAERLGYEVHWLDGEPGLHEEIHAEGLLRIAGPFAFGLLRGEAGLHRLVHRPTPGGQRRTAFAAVEVLPDGEHEAIPPEEISRATFRSGGPNPYS
jgi:peptide chain release factor 2